MDNFLFLDIDGVLNTHQRRANGYAGIQEEFVDNLNDIFFSIPNLKLVISSAWRYRLLTNDMSLHGFEVMLLSHGVCCEGQLVGCTGPDPEDEIAYKGTDGQWSARALKYRADQIRRFVGDAGLERWVAVDDLHLQLPTNNFVLCTRGLTSEKVVEVINKFEEQR